MCLLISCYKTSVINLIILLKRAVMQSAMAPRTLLLLVTFSQLVFGFNEPLNIVSHLNADWFLFGDSRSDCNHINNLPTGKQNYEYMDINPELCKSGKISSKAGNSLFRSFHFTDFYNYSGEGSQIIFYEGVNFSPYHGFKCVANGDNSRWMGNKARFYTHVYERMAHFRRLSIVNITYTYGGNSTPVAMCKNTNHGATLTLNNPLFIGKEVSAPDYKHESEANFTLEGCDEFLVPLCVYNGQFLSSGIYYHDSEYYYNLDTGVLYGFNSTLNITTGLDLTCIYHLLTPGKYKAISNELLLTIPSKALCFQKRKMFTPVQVVDSRWNSTRQSDNMTAVACQLPYCYFRNATNDYSGKYDWHHGDAGFTSILSGLMYNVSCLASQGAFLYDNVSSQWPTYPIGYCPTAANLGFIAPVCVYDPLPVILLGILLGISVLIIIFLVVYFMMDNGVRLHEA